MTTIDPWAIDNSAGAPAYSGGELRLTTVLPFMAGAGASLGARTGVRPSGSATELLVQAQSSPNMTVKVNTGVAVVQGTVSSTQGPYTWGLDTLLSSLTIAASHATLDRTDLVCIRVRDANVDTSGQRDGAVIVVTGTAGGGVPSVPTDATYFTIAQISVVHAVTSITSGAITDKRVNTTALGGVILCTSSTRPASPPSGQQIFETDSGFWWYWSGSAWTLYPGQGFFVRKPSDEARTSTTTLANDTDLTGAVAASATYEVEAVLFYSAGGGAGTGQFKIGFSAPSGASMDWVGIGLVVNGAAGTSGSMAVDYSALTDSRSYGAAGTSTYCSVRVSGTVVTSSAGTFRFQWAQAASSLTATTVKTGSRLTLIRKA